MAKRTKPNRAERQPSNLELKRITPMTASQAKVFDAYAKDLNLVLHGYAGTGKTFSALYLALKQILSNNSEYKKIIIIRSVVPSRDMGFLPGSIKDKIAAYEDPYREICSKLFGRGDAYEILKTMGIITFMSTSFLRGVTMDDSIVILDEAENLVFQECDTVITRLGDNSRILICGDFRQTDLNKKYEREGITSLMQITKRINSFEHIEFQIEDIVRSGVVKDYIIVKTDVGL